MAYSPIFGARDKKIMFSQENNMLYSQARLERPELMI